MISIMLPDRVAASDINGLVTEYGNSILRICFIYLKDIHLAEDAVQDTFLKVYKSYPQFKGNSEIRTWIMRIAINVCKNYYRTSWWKHIDLTKSLNEIPEDSDSGTATDQDDTLLTEIMKLSPKYKEVILLFYYQDMSIREISNVLKIPESTVSVRLSRARDCLRIKMKGWYFYD